LDSAFASQAEETLSAELHRHGSAVAVDPRTHLADLCALWEWRISRGKLTGSEVAISQVRETSLLGDSSPSHAKNVCLAVLEALLAVQQQRADAIEVVAQLDEIALTVPGQTERLNLLLTRLWEALGDPERALRAVRRRHYGWREGPLLASSYLLHEGRLAEVAGDQNGAMRAYRRYLALRLDPEPAFLPQVAEIRTRLSKLTAERTRD
jgi:hypothetical protein